jgi:CBS domain containing-hemolysin-like protein
MSDQSTERSGNTAINVQRLEAGYFAHLESLRNQIPVGSYLLTESTMRWALISMAVISVLIYILFPLTMFIAFTPVVTLVYMLAMIGFGWVFYERVVKPNEGPEAWRD